MYNYYISKNIKFCVSALIIKLYLLNPTFYSKDDPNQFLKYAWCDIHWPVIFDILHFTIYSVDYDFPINYWSPEDVENMRDDIRAFCDKTWWISENDNETRELMDILHEDAIKLLKFFDYYVENKASIHVV